MNIFGGPVPPYREQQCQWLAQYVLCLGAGVFGGVVGSSFVVVSVTPWALPGQAKAVAALQRIDQVVRDLDIDEGDRITWVADPDGARGAMRTSKSEQWVTPGELACLVAAGLVVCSAKLN